MINGIKTLYNRFQLRRHLSCYFKGLPDFKETRMRMVTENDPAEVMNILDYIAERWGSEMAGDRI